MGNELTASNAGQVLACYARKPARIVADKGRTTLYAKISTEELASILCVVPQTIRASLCRKGHYCGIVPLKLPNGRLLWNASEVDSLLSGGAAIEAAPAANDGRTETPVFRYPNQSLVEGRVLARLLSGQRYTQNDAQRELGDSRLADTVVKLREDGWPVMIGVKPVSTSDNRRLDEIGVCYLTDETIASAGESGQRYAAECLGCESGRRAA